MDYMTLDMNVGIGLSLSSFITAQDGKPAMSHDGAGNDEFALINSV